MRNEPSWNYAQDVEKIELNPDSYVKYALMQNGNAGKCSLVKAYALIVGKDHDLNLIYAV
jgi:hypothetical protein